jgi:corrinoid protein of di/trimethylamine methyltransferase
MSQDIFDKLANTVYSGDADGARKAALEAVEKKVDAYDAVMLGCKKGMDIVSAKYEKGEMFVPEILSSAEAMYAAIDVLKPHLDAKRVGETGTVVIGVVEGDNHDIGKNLVRMLLEASGFKVYDLGRDVPLDQFITKACESKADVIAASTLMTTTLLSVEDLMKMLNDQGIRQNFKVIIGGAAVDASFAEQVGADAYAEDASKGVKAVTELMVKRREGK